MLGFLKKIFGLPTQEEVMAAKSVATVEPPVVNSKTGDVVEMPVVAAVPAAVNDQITDAVTQSQPAVKKTRKPRAPKADAVKEKAAKPVKVAAKKVPAKRLKKA